MLYITTKLKRYKALRIALNIVFMPIRLPIYLVYAVGRGAEKVLDFIDSIAYKVRDTIIKCFKFNETAQNQYKINKGKFEDK